jgi:hypothetical protein
MPATSSSADIELIDPLTGTVVPLMIARPLNQSGTAASDAQYPEIREALVASGAGLPLSEWLEPKIIEDWFHGIGLAYDVALGCDTFSAPGYVLPAGAATDVALPATNNSGTRIVAFSDFGSDLFVAQRGSGAANTARVMRSVGGSGALTDSLNLGANEYMIDLLAARDQASGTYYLWASSSNVSGSSGRMHRWDGATWTSTAAATFGTNGRNRMVRVFWEGEDGVGDWRIVTLSSNQGHISYTRPGSDPMLAASWVELVPVGAGEGMGEMTAAKRHVWVVSPENVYDIDELGNSPALTSYTTKHRGNRLSCFYHEGFVYRSLGQGLDRVRVDQGPIIQDTPGLCSPGWGTRAESEWLSGYSSCIGAYLGGILCATFSAPLSRVGIFWGKPREAVGIESTNPLIWHGPFAVCLTGYDISRLHITSTSADPPSNRLWVAIQSTNQTDQPLLSWISLPGAAGAMTDLRSAAGHTFSTGTTGGGSAYWQTFCQLWGLSETAGDKGSMKHVYQQTVGSRGLGDPAGTKLTVYTRADPVPALVPAWGTGVDVLAGPTADITPSTTSGHKIETRIDLFSPNGAASPPKPAILDSLRTTFWRTAPDLDTFTLEIAYGDGVYGLDNTHWPTIGRSVQWTTDQIIAMCRAGRIVIRDRQGNRRSAKLKHFYERTASQHDGTYGKTVTGVIVFADLGAAT